MSRPFVPLLLLGAALLGAGAARAADPSIPAAAEEASGPSAAEEAAERRRALTAINRALTDPVSEVWSVSLSQNNLRLTPGDGGIERWNSRLQFQAAMPVSLTPYLDLVTRPYVELFNSQPHPVPGRPWETDRTVGVGDIILQQFLVPRREKIGNWLLGIGPTWILPAGSSKWTSTGKWQVGPAAAVGYLAEGWVLAAVFQEWRSFAGSGPLDTHTMSLQPIAGLFLPGGWSVGYQGNIRANWTLDQQDRYTVPVGLQVGKVLMLGTTPVKFSVGADWTPVRPSRFGQVWNLALGIQVLRPKLVEGHVLSDPANLRFRW